MKEKYEESKETSTKNMIEHTYIEVYCSDDSILIMYFQYLYRTNCVLLTSITYSNSALTISDDSIIQIKIKLDLN